MKLTSEVENGANLCKGGIVWLMAVVLLALTPLSAFAGTLIYGTPATMSGPLFADGSAQAVATVTVTADKGGANASSITVLLSGTVASGDVTQVSVIGSISYTSAVGSYGSGSSVVCTGTAGKPGNVTVNVYLAPSAAGKTVGIAITADDTGTSTGLPATSGTVSITAPPASNSYGTMTSMAGPLNADLSQQTVATVPVTQNNGGLNVSSYTVNISGTVASGDVTGIYVTDGTSTWSATGSYGNGSSVVCSGANAKPGATLSIKVTLAASAGGKTMAVILNTDSNSAATLPKGPSNALSITAPPALSNTITACDGCHGYPNPVADGTARNNPEGTFVGDHAKHNYVCSTCHVIPATTTSADFPHRNGTINIKSGTIGSSDNGTYSKGASFAQSNAPAFGTCSAVNCHGNLLTPTWGTGATTCTSCHALPSATGAHTKHYTEKGWTTGVTTNCTVCHPNNTSAHSDVTNNSIIVNASLSPSGASPAITCAATPTGCHNGKTTPAWNTTGITCTNCHTVGGAGNDPTSGLHAVVPSVSGVQHDDSFGTGGTCLSCHPNLNAQTTHANGTFTGNGSVAGDRTAMGLATFYTNGGVDNNGSCATTTCHLGNSDAWAHKWNSTANFYTTNVTACGGCHGNDLTVANLGVTGVDHLTVSAKHNVTATNYKCRDCHAIESASGYTFTWSTNDWGGSSHHGNGNITINDDVAGVGGNITGWQRGTGGNSSKSLCLKCHSSWTDSAPQHWAVNTGWTSQEVAGNAITSACGECHTGGVTPSAASGAHTIHNAGTAALLAGGAACTPCHGDNSGLGYQNATAGTHGNLSVNFVGVAYSTATRNDLTGTCLTASCHNVNTKTERSNAWNATQLECNDCHYYEAAPNSANNAAHGRPLSASHGDHFAKNKACSNCHTVPAVGDTAHINGGTTALTDKAVALMDEATVTRSGMTFSDAANTCSGGIGLGCHATGTPDWDIAIAATDCTTYCHTDTTTATVNPTSGLHGVTPSITGKKHDATLDATNKCAKCHPNALAQTTHANGTFTGNGAVAGDRTAMGLATFYTTGGTDNNGSCATTTCHLSNSDDWAHKWNSTANYYTTNGTACGGCHGDWVRGWNTGVIHRTSANTQSNHGDGGTNYECKECHVIEDSNNAYPFTFGTNDWLALNAGNKHGNSGIEVNNATGTTYNTTSGLCTGCHTNSDGTHNYLDTAWTINLLVGSAKPSGTGHAAGANCKGCHAAANGTKRGIQAEFNGTYNHGPDSTSAWTSLANADCEACHDETSGPDGIVNLKVVGGTTANITWAASYTQATLASMNSHCLSCHDGAGTSIGGVAPTTRDNINTLWANTTYASHSQTGNVVPAKTKARSAHAAPATNILKDETGRTGYTTAVACLECHPAHGSSVKSPDSAKGNLAIVGNMMKTGYSEPGTCWTCHDAAGVKDYMGDSTTAGTHWSGTKKSAFAYKQRAFLSTHEVNGAGQGFICSVCHNPHGSTTGAQYNTPMLRGTWMTSPYPEDRTGKMNGSALAGAYATKSTADNGPRQIANATFNKPANWGHGYGAAAGTGHDGYYIDDNTFGSNNTAYTATGTIPKQITPADASVFGGLCASCHIGSTYTGGTVAQMKTYLDTTTFATGWGASVHNAVKGWSDGTTDCVSATNSPKMHLLQVTNTNGIRYIRDTGYYSPRSSYDWGSHQNAGTQAGYHAFPCSKCHTPHANSLPKLMVTNCLDVGTGTTSRKAHGTEPAFTQTTYSVFAGGNANVQESAMHCHNRGKLNTNTGGGWNKVTGW